MWLQWGRICLDQFCYFRAMLKIDFRIFSFKKYSNGLYLSKIYCSFENESKNRIFPDPFRRKKSGFGGSTRIENRVIHLRSFGDLFTPLAPAGIPVNFEWRHVSYYQTGEKRQLFFWRQNLHIFQKFLKMTVKTEERDSRRKKLQGSSRCLQDSSRCLQGTVILHPV